MDVLTPIPTWYAGTRFRSRAEARWAVLFGRVGLRYRYEDEGFKLPSFWYLPDFWLPQWRVFAEVKGGFEQWDEIAYGKAKELAIESRRSVLLLDEIDPLVPYVRVLAQDGCEFVLDFPQSLLRGCCWYETERSADRELCLSDDSAWEAAAARASLWQFERHAAR